MVDNRRPGQIQYTPFALYWPLPEEFGLPTFRGVRWLKPISTLRSLAPISPRKSWLLRVQPDDSIAAPAMVKHTKEVSDVQIEKGSPRLLKIVNVGAK